jgi:DNA-binding transcriptional regulator YhcF (GntR family)
MSSGFYPLNSHQFHSAENQPYSQIERQMKNGKVSGFKKPDDFLLSLKL